MQTINAATLGNWTRSPGLFRNAISLSGTALHHWAFSSPAAALERSRILVRRLRVKMAEMGDVTLAVQPSDQPAQGESPADVLRFLQQVDAGLLADYNNYCDVEDVSTAARCRNHRPQWTRLSFSSLPSLRFRNRGG